MSIERNASSSSKRSLSVFSLALGLAFNFGALPLLLTGCPGSIDDPSLFETDTGTKMPSCGDVVTTVFTPTCAVSGCHSTSDMAGTLDLQAPNIYMRLVGKSASGGPGVLIESGKPMDSVLYMKLTANPPFGSQMPLVGAKLDTAMLACVADWITADGQVTGD
jgi:hypothetical protein